MLATWGVSLILQQMVRSIFGANNREVGAPSYMAGVWDFGGFQITYGRAWIIVFGLLVFSALFAAMKFTALGLRMRAHSAAALQLAQWLETQPAVERVYYPGLPSHPQHELAKRQQSGFGGIVSFEVRGGREAAGEVGEAGLAGLRGRERLRHSSHPLSRSSGRGSHRLPRR